jgi:phospholipid/cholesterol/gamma-HCH transport system substrate-binding protein
MSRNFVETLLGAVVLVVAIVFLSYSTKVGEVGKGDDGYHVYANFSEIGGLRVGDDVRISGVKVGSVAALELQKDTYLAQATLNIDPSVKLPEDTASIISSEGLLGGVFLALEPGGAEEYLEEGGRITYNQDAQNLEKLLGQFIFSLQGDKEEDDG